MSEAIISAEGTEAPTVRSERFTIYVLPRIHERHPELTAKDVLTAFRSAMQEVRRNDGTWMLVSLDGRGRNVEVLYAEKNGMVVIYHAFTPPTKKIPERDEPAEEAVMSMNERDRQLLAMVGMTEEQVERNAEIAESETIPDGLVGPVYYGLHMLPQSEA